MMLLTSAYNGITLESRILTLSPQILRFLLYFPRSSGSDAITPAPKVLKQLPQNYFFFIYMFPYFYVG